VVTQTIAFLREKKSNKAGGAPTQGLLLKPPLYVKASDNVKKNLPKF
jgi:hypothetical protein